MEVFDYGEMIFMEDMQKQKNDSAPLQVYKPSGWMQLGLAAAIIFVVVHFSIMMRAGMEVGWFFLILIPLYGFILWLLLISSSQQHLAIYENGLEYRMGNNRRFSRWEDMRHFEIRSQGKSSIIGIYSSHIEKRQDGSFIERLLSSSHTDLIPLSVVHVPIRRVNWWTRSVVDTAKFAESELGRELLHYAPQLFEDTEEKNKR
jgi:hypothetical protein